MKLHEDWPEITDEDLAKAYDGDDAYLWGLEDPAGDLAIIFKEARDCTLTLRDIEKIKRYYVSWNGTQWRGGPRTGGSELEMVVFGKLKDGRWFVATGGNDYTGWGCMGDFAEVVVHATKAESKSQGMTNSDRLRLGYPEVTG